MTMHGVTVLHPAYMAPLDELACFATGSLHGFRAIPVFAWHLQIGFGISITQGYGLVIARAPHRPSGWWVLWIDGGAVQYRQRYGFWGSVGAAPLTGVQQY